MYELFRSFSLPTSPTSQSPFRFVDGAFNKMLHEIPTQSDRVLSDVYCENDNVCVELDMAGFAKENIEVSHEGDILVVRGERKSERKGSSRFFGKLERRFDLPNVNWNEVKAKLENGVLKITIPYKNKEPNITNKIDIE